MKKSILILITLLTFIGCNKIVRKEWYWQGSSYYCREYFEDESTRTEKYCACRNDTLFVLQYYDGEQRKLFKTVIDVYKHKDDDSFDIMNPMNPFSPLNPNNTD